MRRLLLCLLLTACGSEENIVGEYSTKLTHQLSISSCDKDVFDDYHMTVVINRSTNGYDLTFGVASFRDIDIVEGKSLFVRTKTSPNYEMFFGSITRSKISGMLTLAFDGDWEKNTARCFRDFAVSGTKI